MRRVALYRDGNQMATQIGPDWVEGIARFGDTVAEALRDLSRGVAKHDCELRGHSVAIEAAGEFIKATVAFWMVLFSGLRNVYRDVFPLPRPSVEEKEMRNLMKRVEAAERYRQARGFEPALRATPVVWPRQRRKIKAAEAMDILHWLRKTTGRKGSENRTFFCAAICAARRVGRRRENSRCPVQLPGRDRPSRAPALSWNTEPSRM